MSRFTTRHAQERHRASLAFVDRTLSESFDGPSVVVTYHVPALGSIARRFDADIVTVAFVSDLAATILRRRPATWVHGHTRGSFDYSIGTTRVVCNARVRAHSWRTRLPLLRNVERLAILHAIRRLRQCYRIHLIEPVPGPRATIACQSALNLQVIGQFRSPYQPT